eukprot:1544320-Prymnesium_polylepis.2
MGHRPSCVPVCVKSEFPSVCSHPPRYGIYTPLAERSPKAPGRTELVHARTCVTHAAAALF